MIIRLTHYYNVPERRARIFAIDTPLSLEQVAMTASILEMLYDCLPHDIMSEDTILEEHVLSFWQQYRPQDNLYWGKAHELPPYYVTLDIHDIRFVFSDDPDELERKYHLAIELARQLPLRRVLLEADLSLLAGNVHSERSPESRAFWASRHDQLKNILASGLIPEGIQNIFGHDCGGILDKPAEELVKEFFEPYKK